MEAPPVWGGVVVAAGRSVRFGDVDKTLVALAGRSILAHSISAMLTDQRLRALVVVASPDNIDDCRELVDSGFPGIAILTCLGGTTRSESVRAGLAALPPGINFVAIHDAARPLVPAVLIRAVLDAAEQYGAALPALAVTSTLLVEGEGKLHAGSLERDRVREAQTPQAAHRPLLESALRAYPDETDESTALFRLGARVASVPGDRHNIKITTPDDLKLANALLSLARSQI